MALEASRATVGGLTRVGVHVEPVNADAEGDGLTRALLQTEVESRLRESGIGAVSSTGLGADVPGDPVLHLDVMTVGLDGRYAYSVRLELWQPVRLIRDPTIVAPGVTWSGLQFVGVVARERLSEVRRAVDSAIEEFIQDWRPATAEVVCPPDRRLRPPPAPRTIQRRRATTTERIRGRLVDIEIGAVQGAGWVALAIVRHGLDHEKGLRFEATALDPGEAAERVRTEVEAYFT
jgi:hypothetical protein